MATPSGSGSTTRNVFLSIAILLLVMWAVLALFNQDVADAESSSLVVTVLDEDSGQEVTSEYDQPIDDAEGPRLSGGDLPDEAVPTPDENPKIKDLVHRVPDCKPKTKCPGEEPKSDDLVYRVPTCKLKVECPDPTPETKPLRFEDR